MSRIAVIGTGYVGLTTGACFSALGHEVVCADIDEDKVARLQRGEIPILEAGRRISGCEDVEGLPDLLAKPQFRDEMQRRLDALSKTGTSATTRITRAVLIPEMPSGIELTDKSTLSFSGVMNRREADIRALYSGGVGNRFLYSESASSLSKTSLG